MQRTRRLIGALGTALTAGAFAIWITAPPLNAGADDIAGTVSGPKGAGGRRLGHRRDQ